MNINIYSQLLIALYSFFYIRNIYSGTCKCNKFSLLWIKNNSKSYVYKNNAYLNAGFKYKRILNFE